MVKLSLDLRRVEHFWSYNMSYFNSRTHAFFTFTRDDEERMRNKFMPSTSEGTLCTYCEEVECSGTSEIDCIYSEDTSLK